MPIILYKLDYGSNEGSHSITYQLRSLSFLFSLWHLHVPLHRIFTSFFPYSFESCPIISHHQTEGWDLLSLFTAWAALSRPTTATGVVFLMKSLREGEDVPAAEVIALLTSVGWDIRTLGTLVLNLLSERVLEWVSWLCSRLVTLLITEPAIYCYYLKHWRSISELLWLYRAWVGLRWGAKGFNRDWG